MKPVSEKNRLFSSTAILLWASFVHALQDVNNNDRNNSNKDMASAMADSLNHEECDPYLVGFSGEFLMELTSRLDRPVRVMGSGDKTKRTKAVLGRCVVVVVPGRTDADDLRLVLAGFSAILGSVRRFYIVEDEDKEAEEVDLKGLAKPALMFARSLQDGNINLKIKCPGSKVMPLMVSTWNKETQGKTSSSTGWIPRIDPNLVCPRPLQGKKVTVSATGIAPHIIYTSNGSLAGVDPTAIGIIAKKLGFTYKFEMEQVWGLPLPNSSTEWSGVIGKVKSGSSQFGIGSITIQANRAAVVDYTAPLYTLNMHLMATKPRPLASYTNFTLPFTPTVWAMVLLATVVATLVNLLAMWCMRRTEGRDRQQLDVGREVLAFYKNILFQHADYSPWSCISSSVTWFFWHPFALVIIYGFSSDFRAFLMTVSYEHPVDSVQDLLDQHRRLFLPQGTPLIAAFATSPLRDQQEINKDIERYQQYFYFEKGFASAAFERRMIKEGIAYLTGREQGLASLAESDRRHGYVPFRVGRKAVLPFYAGFVVPRGAPWKAEVDATVLRLVAGGVVDQLIRSNIQSKYLVEEDGGDRRPVAFKVGTVLGVIFLWVGGLGLGAVVFVVEVVFGKGDRKKKRKMETV